MRMLLKTLTLFAAMISTLHAADNIEAEDLVRFRAQAEAATQAAFIKQIGNDNETSITQSGGNNIAIAVVTGNDNNFDLTQKGSFGTNSMELFQTGNDNTAFVQQSNFLSPGNQIQALQTGSNNRLRLSKLECSLRMLMKLI